MSRKYIILSAIFLMFLASWIVFLSGSSGNYVKRNFYINDNPINCQTDYRYVRTLVPIIYQSVSSHFETASRNNLNVRESVRFGITSTLDSTIMIIKKGDKVLYKGKVIEDISIYINSSDEYVIEVDEKIFNDKNMIKENGYFKHECYIKFNKN